MFEVNLRRALLISGGSFSIFFTRPIALVAIIICIALISLNIYQALTGKKKMETATD